MLCCLQMSVHRPKISGASAGGSGSGEGSHTAQLLAGSGCKSAGQERQRVLRQALGGPPDAKTGCSQWTPCLCNRCRRQLAAAAAAKNHGKWCAQGFLCALNLMAILYLLMRDRLCCHLHQLSRLSWLHCISCMNT